MLFRESVSDTATDLKSEPSDILGVELDTIEGERTTVKNICEGYKLTIVVNVASK